MRLALTLLLVVTLVYANDDDLEFEELTSSTPALSSTTSAPVRRQWGVPDFQAVVGKLFVAAIPKDAFSGDVDYYEVWIDLRVNYFGRSIKRPRRC